MSIGIPNYDDNGKASANIGIFLCNGSCPIGIPCCDENGKVGASGGISIGRQGRCKVIGIPLSCCNGNGIIGKNNGW